MNYLESLNTEQRKAVLTTQGPVLIIAGAGAGKTKTLTHRIFHLMQTGVAPENILAITFTNKAAREMRERVEHMLNHQDDSGLRSTGMPFMSTFHSLGVHIIKENSDILGIPRHFSIYDTADSKKAVKEALVYIGVDPKEHSDKVRHIISQEKGRGVRMSEYAERDAYDYTSELTKKVWRKYEEILRRDGALDFDDLLLHTLTLLEKYPHVREKYQNRFMYVHVDEYQDTNKVQNRIIDLIADKYKNICVVGDADQCVTEGTKIKMADGFLKNIENIKNGEYILSNYGGGNFRPAKIIGKKTSRYTGNIVRIETQNGNILESTPEHIHFAGYQFGITPQIYVVYLMYKKNIGWRIGTTSVYTKGQKKSIIGFIQRSNQEHADACWVISTHNTQNEARCSEYILSLTYQIPTLPFTPRKGISTNGYVHDEKMINKIFSNFNTQQSAEKLLSDKGLLREHPHHQPQTHNSNRRNIRITLCADKRGKTPVHTISIQGNDAEGAEKIKSLGFSVRPSKKSGGWRFETANSNYGIICMLGTKIAGVFPETNFIFSARLGKKKISTKDTNSLPCTPAGSIVSGMALFTENGYDIVSHVTKKPLSKVKVFDIDIEKTHNYIANNIVTHNCIYGWRGAEIKHMLHFEKTYPHTHTVFLEENYRSTQTILAVANTVIEKNKFRIPKKLFTQNHTGDRVGIFSGRDEYDEAHFIATKAKQCIENGISADDIAVLYRANFQSRVLEEAFLAHTVPYQLLGTKFFERKEVKDVLSFIKASLNPDARGDFLRIINIPPRGIGKTTIDKIIEEREHELSASTHAKIENFKQTLVHFREKLLTLSVSEAVKYIIITSGMEKMYSTGMEEDTDRLENIMELVTIAQKYDDLPRPDGIEQFLTDSSLASDQDTLDTPQNGVKLMTVHASKGLEFNTVFISGLESDLFPHKGMGGQRKSADDSEEERRLFYVAITRAEKKLFLTYAHTRTIFGSIHVNAPSEFLDDIPDTHSEQESWTGNAHGRDRKPLLSIDF